MEYVEIAGTEVKEVATPSAGRILRSWLVEKAKANPAYSLRSMARNLGVSSGFLSLVMNGRKRLSIERALRFAELMRLAPEQTKELMRAVTLEMTSKGTRERALLEDIVPEIARKSRYVFVEAERFKVLSRWYHLAILDLTDTRDFVDDPKWIASRLKISSVHAADALERLKDLGLLIEADGRWKKCDEQIAFCFEQSHVAIREHHQQMIAKGVEALSDPAPEAFNQRSITGITVSANPEKLPEAFKMIEEFNMKLAQFLAAGERSEVYQLNVQLFNLSHPLKNQVKSYEM